MPPALPPQTRPEKRDQSERRASRARASSEKGPPGRNSRSQLESGRSHGMRAKRSSRIEDGPSGGTHVKWAADAKISGMMASVGSRLIDAQANKYVKQIIGSLEKNLS